MNDKSSKSPTAQSASANTDADEADSVDKIRDILFGNQIREVDRRFASLENSLASDLAAMRSETAMQFESLKTFIESEIEILGSKLIAEEKARVEDADEMDDRIKQQAKQLDKKIADLSRALDKQASDINQKILKQSQEFSSELGKQIGEARARMDGQRQELATTKVDKLQLAELFNSLALQINQDENSK